MNTVVKRGNRIDPFLVRGREIKITGWKNSQRFHGKIVVSVYLYVDENTVARHTRIVTLNHDSPAKFSANELSNWVNVLDTAGRNDKKSGGRAGQLREDRCRSVVLVYSIYKTRK